jgi:hypothetical protein
MPIAFYKVDFEEAARLVAPVERMILGIVADAIAVERERCAQVAENFNAAGKPIAAAIRQL